jgi:hypothetical protein
MLIIDSQVHVWPPDRPDRPLGPGHTERIPKATKIMGRGLAECLRWRC